MFQQIQLSLFNMGNICVVLSPLLDTHNIFSCFIFLLFKDFSIVFSLFVNCKQRSTFFGLLAYPLQVSSAIEFLKLTLREAAYYLSYSVETKPVKCLSINLSSWSTNFKYSLLRKLLCYFCICHK